MKSSVTPILLACVADGLAALAGALMPAWFVRRWLNDLLAFAAGTLLGVAFLELVPEAARHGFPIFQIMLWSLIGFTLFQVVEGLFSIYAKAGQRHTLMGPFVLAGDALHNVTDGVAISAAFLVDAKAGVATTIAVLLHELPHEISDYAILLAQGYPKNKALWLLLLAQSSALVGALGAWWTSTAILGSMPYLLSLTTGGFLYIGATDLLPEIRDRKTGSGELRTSLVFIAGLLLMYALR